MSLLDCEVYFLHISLLCNSFVSICCSFGVALTWPWIKKWLTAYTCRFNSKANQWGSVLKKGTNMSFCFRSQNTLGAILKGECFKFFSNKIICILHLLKGILNQDIFFLFFFSFLVCFINYFQWMHFQCWEHLKNDGVVWNQYMMFVSTSYNIEANYDSQWTKLSLCTIN